ncbi:MAG: hypothetical protein ACTSPI_16840 [Candidatus Heimdallarchaeaceae archaeon]
MKERLLDFRIIKSGKPIVQYLIKTKYNNEELEHKINEIKKGYEKSKKAITWVDLINDLQKAGYIKILSPEHFFVYL